MGEDMFIKLLNKKNLILVSGIAFATAIAVCGASLSTGEIDISATENAIISSTIEVSASTEGVSIATESISASVEGSSEQVSAPVVPIDAALVVPYEVPKDMFATTTVNIRSGAGTEFDKLGKLAWGSPVKVTGETGNGWYEIAYNDGKGYVSMKYVSEGIPGVPFLFVGDSRTVQMKTAVGSNDKAYVAKIGEGYSWFKNTALPQIPNYAGNGTVMVINFGVNDLANAPKYIQLINNNIDAWTASGIKVYYAAVTPVKNCKTVSNEQIERFNAKLKSQLDPRISWIDGYSYLQQNGFSTGDGLHYNNSTYKNLYSYYMSVINASDA